MSTYLIACTPAHGHVVPLVRIARDLLARGHAVSVLTSARYAERVRAAGARFVPLPADADVNLDDADAEFPERVGLRGPAAIRFDMSNLFIRPAASQFAALRAELAGSEVDAVLAEPLFFGAALLARLPREERPAVVALGIFPLGVKSRDTAPFGLGIPPLGGAIGRVRNAALSVLAENAIFGGVQREADAVCRRETGTGLAGFILDWASAADALVQFTVPGFEYPRSDLPDTVHFAGPLTAPAPDTAVPEWWDDLDGTRPVVHVTQGTIANSDFGQLVLPTVAAMAASECLVVVSTGGRARESLPAELPANVRVAEYLPYDRFLPLVDVMVTNGGYGGVQQALAHAVPLVVAGQTEDKVEVCARVGWSGAGINLKTNRPAAAAVGAAVSRVLSESSFRARAEALSAELRASSGVDGLSRVLQQMSAREGAR